VKPPESRIIHGTSPEALAEFPDCHFDAVVIDPPYGTASVSKIQTHSGKTCEGFDIDWDAHLPLDWIPEAVRTLKPGGSMFVFTDTKATTILWDALAAAGVRPLQCFYWIKLNPPPQPRKNFQSGAEVAVFARKPGSIVHWGGGGATLNWYACPLTSNTERTAHPTQKPLRLMRHIVPLLSPEGGSVLDPFAGSGTTGMVAQSLSRRAVLIDLSMDYLGQLMDRNRDIPLGLGA